MADNGKDVLNPILLRSTTPASDEKVLSYLEGMERAEISNSPPGSIVDHEEYGSRRSGHSQRILSPTPRSRASDQLQNLAHSSVSYGNQPEQAPAPAEEVDDDIDSTQQEHSDLGTAQPLHEPGPHDPPGPHYESYDSGPSFGNLGPLPDDYAPPMNAAYMNTWAPQFNMNNHMQAQPIQPWQTHPMQPFGMQGAMQVPVPDELLYATPKGSLNIEVETPSTPGSKFFPGNGAPPSHKPPSVTSERRQKTASPSSYAGSKAPEVRQPVAPLSPPLSPTSMRSQQTARTRGSVYPPLPASPEIDDLGSPRSKAPTRSKAYSVAPSDSLSQVHTKVRSTTKSPSRIGGSTAHKSEVGEAGAGSRQTQGVPSRSPTILSGGHQNRPFSPYRHAPTTEDLLNAAVRGRAMVIPELSEPSQQSQSKAPSVVQNGVPSPPTSPPPKTARTTDARSTKTASKAPSKAPSVATTTAKTVRSKAPSAALKAPSVLALSLQNEAERLIEEALSSRTPKTSYYSPSVIEPEVTNQFHDVELCVLLHQLDENPHEVVKKALRKAVRQRVKKLGLKHDAESIKEYAKSHASHDPTFHAIAESSSDEPPRWAADLKREFVLMQQRIESLGPKIDNLRATHSQEGSTHEGGEADGYYEEGNDDYATEQTPATQTVNIQPQATGTLAEYQPPSDIIEDPEELEHTHFDEGTRTPRQQLSEYGFSQDGRDDSPGHQLLEQELWRLHQKKVNGSQSSGLHRTWEVGLADLGEYQEHEGQDDNHVDTAPTIPDGDENFSERPTSPPLPPIPAGSQGGAIAPTWQDENSQEPPPWMRIHGRLLSWAMIWPMGEFDKAINSTTRGQQVDEVALSIWTTQTYKRYVRSRLTERPQGVVDRLFVPPNMADAISTAVFNGRHGEACGILRDLWSPFGLDGTPRLLVVLAKHRSDENHWVVHRFSLPDGALTTYDSFPDRTLPDGRPLGWWFAIKIAWPSAIYPSPDHLMQKMVRLHRPLQLPIDNSVAAAGIWRNILMGSRAERSVDLERLRDLINTEVKNLRQRKHLGKLAINTAKPNWGDMN